MEENAFDQTALFEGTNSLLEREGNGLKANQINCGTVHSEAEHELPTQTEDFEEGFDAFPDSVGKLFVLAGFVPLFAAGVVEEFESNVFGSVFFEDELDGGQCPNLSSRRVAKTPNLPACDVVLKSRPSELLNRLCDSRP